MGESEWVHLGKLCGHEVAPHIGTDARSPFPPLEIHHPGMPPPDLSQHESLALSQAKALARAGVDPNEASSASAFLEVNAMRQVL